MSLKEIIKSQLNNILLVIGYIAVALAVYITLSISLGWPWWATTLISLAIIIAGVIIGYFFIKMEIKAKDKEEVKTENNKE